MTQPSINHNAAINLDAASLQDTRETERALSEKFDFIY